MEVLLVPANVDDPSGCEVVHKTATQPGERERLLREAAMLRMAAARGVRGLAAVVTPPAADDPEPTLVTSAVAGPSLAVAAPLPVGEVAGVAAEVASLLAGLHEAGLVHGAVEPGHVVLDGEGGAILVGLGDGGEAGAPGPAEADGRAVPLDPASDVAGWGALLTHLLDWSATGDEPLVALRRAIGARPRRRRVAASPRLVEEERRVLATLADQAQDPDPARRPTARSLAATIAHRVPTARLPGAVPAAGPPPSRASGLLDRLSAHVSGAPGDDGPAQIATGLTAPRSAGHAARGGAPGVVSPGPGPGRLDGPEGDGARPDAEIGAAGTAFGPRGRRGRRPRRHAQAPLPLDSVDDGRADAPLSPAVPLTPPRQPSDQRPLRGPARIPLARLALLVVVGVGLVAAAGLTLVARGPSSAAARHPVAGPRQTAPVGCPSASPPVADVDGDGCEETV
ncbi:MAG: hypothetical protein ABIS47_06145, partial [Acidimicrobiales bacterium]